MTIIDMDYVESEQKEKVHPWRICPLGKHYVKEHQERIPPSKKHPAGEVIIRHAHCARNPLGKHKKEVKAHFPSLQGPPKANVLHYDRADEFDDLIRGWVLYWNEVFKEINNPLDPNLVKALIASELSFDPDVIFCHENYHDFTLDATGCYHAISDYFLIYYRCVH